MPVTSSRSPPANDSSSCSATPALPFVLSRCRRIQPVTAGRHWSPSTTSRVQLDRSSSTALPGPAGPAAAVPPTCRSIPMRACSRCRFRLARRCTGRSVARLAASGPPHVHLPSESTAGLTAQTVAAGRPFPRRLGSSRQDEGARRGRRQRRRAGRWRPWWRNARSRLLRSGWVGRPPRRRARGRAAAQGRRLSRALDPARPGRRPRPGWVSRTSPVACTSRRSLRADQVGVVGRAARHQGTFDHLVGLYAPTPPSRSGS